MIEILAVWLLLFGASYSPVRLCIVLILGVLVLQSSLWTFLDAKERAERNGVDVPPRLTAVFVGLSWSIGLPAYFLVRSHSRYSSLEDQNGSGRSKLKWSQVLGSLLAFLLFAATWVCAFALGLKVVNYYRLPPEVLNDRVDLMFGAASIALIGITILASLVAIVGWQSLRQHLDDLVESRFEASVEDLRRSTKLAVDGRINSLTGILFWRLAVGDCRTEDPDMRMLLEEQTDVDPVFLDAAIHHARRSVRALENSDSNFVWTAKNNLAHFLSTKGSRDDEPLARRLADELMERYQNRRNFNHLLTYVKVKLTYIRTAEESDELERLLAELGEGGQLHKELGLERQKLIPHYLKVLRERVSAGLARKEPSAEAPVGPSAAFKHWVSEVLASWAVVKRR